MNAMKREGKEKERGIPGDLRYGLYFLAIVLLVYIVVFFLERDGAARSLKASYDVLVQIIPVLLLVLVIMGVMNYLVSPKGIRKYVGEGSGAKGWAIAIGAGILSHGPIYVWYPFLRDLRDQGMRSGLIAAFLYNRGIKIPLLPIMIFYFGLSFAGVLVAYMVVASVVQGKLIEVLEGSSWHSASDPDPSA